MFIIFSIDSINTTSFYFGRRIWNLRVLGILRNYLRDLGLVYMYENIVIIMFFQCSKQDMRFLINIIFILVIF